MAAKKAKPGPKKGVPKPHAHRMEPGFHVRLKAAMVRRRFVYDDGDTMNAALGKEVGCSHQAIGQYLNQPRITIDAVLLLKLCDALSVTPYWLALDEGDIEDVPTHKLPLQELRKKSAPTRRIEETPVEIDR